MTRIFTIRLLAVLICSCWGWAAAGELSDRVDVGDFIPSYASTKCGGFDDGVAIGKTTCYTCRSGEEPVFYVFIRTRSEPVLRLAGEIDALVAAKRKDRVVGVVNFLGDPKNEAAQAEVRTLGEKQGLKNVAVTLTADGSKFDLDEAADVTVIIFENGIIRLRSTATAAQLNEKSIELLLRRARSLMK